MAPLEVRSAFPDHTRNEREALGGARVNIALRRGCDPGIHAGHCNGGGPQAGASTPMISAFTYFRKSVALEDGLDLADIEVVSREHHPAPACGANSAFQRRVQPRAARSHGSVSPVLTCQGRAILFGTVASAAAQSRGIQRQPVKFPDELIHGLAGGPPSWAIALRAASSRSPGRSGLSGRRPWRISRLASPMKDTVKSGMLAASSKLGSPKGLARPSRLSDKRPSLMCGSISSAL